MQKKIFVQKNVRSGSGSRSYAKLLLWAAVSLMVLVLIAPLFSRHGKESREAAKKPDSERGIVVKEIPRSLELLQPDGPQKQEPAGDLTKTGGSESPASSTPAPLPAPVATGQPASPEAKPPASAVQDGDKTQSWVEMPKAPHAEAPVVKESAHGPVVSDQTSVVKKEEVSPPKDKTPASVAKKLTPPPAASAGELKQKKPAVSEEPKKIAKTPPSTTPEAAAADALMPAKPSLGKETAGSYAVQVGSFKEKQNAEEMQQNLQKRGYQVQMKPATHPKLGTIYVVQLAPVTDVSKASTLLEQIKHEERVKPMIIKVPQNP